VRWLRVGLAVVFWLLVVTALVIAWHFFA